jgi:hypothetical protein
MAHALFLNQCVEVLEKERRLRFLPLLRASQVDTLKQQMSDVDRQYEQRLQVLRILLSVCVGIVSFLCVLDLPLSLSSGSRC